MKNFDLVIKSIKYNSRYKVSFLYIFISKMLLTGCMLSSAIVWANLISAITQNTSNIGTSVVYVLSVRVIAVLSNIVYTRSIAVFNKQISNEAKIEIFNKLLEMPMEYHDQLMPGEISSRIHQDINMLSNIVVVNVFNLIFSIIEAIAIIIIILQINVYLSILTISIFPLLFIIMKNKGKKIQIKNKEILEISNKYYNVMFESSAHIKEIKSLDLKEYQKQNFKKQCINMNETQYECQMLNLKSDIICNILNTIMSFIVVCILGYLTVNNNFNIAYFMIFTNYSMRINDTLLNISSQTSSFYEALPSLTRIFEILEWKQINKTNTYKNYLTEIDRFNIEINDLNFRYNQGPKVFDGLNLKIKENTKVILLGKSGIGKTTLFNLIMGLYSLDKGMIRIGGKDISGLNEDDLSKFISIVPQEPYLFNGTISENLKLLNPKATQCEIEDACKKAEIHEFIMSLSLQYETPLGEKGMRLSIGQKQRLAIARVLNKNTPIILFDEATSALDARSENVINTMISKISKNHTVLMITHQAKLAKDADQIVHMDKLVVSTNVSKETFVS